VPAVSPLYVIVDVDVCLASGCDPLALADAAAAAGVSHLQIRAKKLGGAALLDLVERVAATASARGTSVIVNDRVDVAKTAGVGVHLGQTDLPVVDARVLLGPAAVIGVSTHTLAQIDDALAGPATYIAYGPVFATVTKANLDPVVGLDGVAEAARRAHKAGRPLVAIGGITLATASGVIRAGADAVAVISDLVRGGEPPATRIGRFLRAVEVEPV
jgi:thiamine-phosphate pyrophosphorylase